MCFRDNIRKYPMKIFLYYKDFVKRVDDFKGNQVKEINLDVQSVKN